MDPRALRTMVLLAMVTALLALATFGAHRALRVLEQRRCAPAGASSPIADECPTETGRATRPATLR